MTDVLLRCGPRCVVRTFRAGDAASLARHGNDRSIWLNLRDRFPHPYTPEMAAGYIASMRGVARPTSLAIEVDGEAAGGVSVRPGDDVERVSAEVGYWLGRAYWGQGITTAAVSAVSEAAFEWFALTRLFALPFAHNVASARVLEKAGYARVGVLHRSAIKDGVVVDQLLYERVRAPDAV